MTRTVTGNAIVVVNDGDFGKGWNVAGLDHLVSVSGGMLYVYGSGGARLFTGSGGTYTSPANDQGTLVKNGNNTYTYTDKHQQVWNFDTSGNLVTMVEPHGLTRTFTYDANGQVLTQKDMWSTTLTFTYDNVGNRTKVQDSFTTETLGGSTKTYTYDTRSQLTADSTSSYGYDNAGNRNNSGQTINTGNRLASDATYNYTYDDEGNLVTKVSIALPATTTTYTWDVNNRLTSIDKYSVYNITYKYDVFGNRIEQVEDADGAGPGASVTTRFAVEGSKVMQDAWGNRTAPVGTENWNVWADLNGSNALQVRYVRGDATDELFSRVKNDGTVASYLTDRMGSVRQMVDASGAVQDTIAYDGFGNVISESNASFGDRWKWTGRELNINTGLQYNRARYFNGGVGRWINEDPLGFNGADYNISRYVGNRTINVSDPSGMRGWAEAIASWWTGVDDEALRHPPGWIQFKPTWGEWFASWIAGPIKNSPALGGVQGGSGGFGTGVLVGFIASGGNPVGALLGGIIGLVGGSVYGIKEGAQAGPYYDTTKPPPGGYSGVISGVVGGLVAAATVRIFGIEGFQPPGGGVPNLPNPVNPGTAETWPEIILEALKDTIH